MNRDEEDGKAGQLSVPRTRGDEPFGVFPQLDGPDARDEPADENYNAEYSAVPRTRGDEPTVKPKERRADHLTVPRTRGDEPDITTVAGVSIDGARSPHARG